MVARFVQDNEDFAYRIYETDTLQIIAKNGGYYGAAYPQKRFFDLVDDSPKDNRTCQEIVNDVAKKSGLVVTK